VETWLYTPSAFGIGIIPLVKGPSLDKSILLIIANTLILVVSKLFEMIMLHLLGDFFSILQTF